MRTLLLMFAYSMDGRSVRHAVNPGFRWKPSVSLAMQASIKILLGAACLAAGTTHVIAQPAAGSGLALEDDACATCHGEPDLWEADQTRLFIPQESLAEDEIGRANV